MAILARYFGHNFYGDYVFIVPFVFIFNPLINFVITPVMVREMLVRKVTGSYDFGFGFASRLVMAAIAMLIILAILP